MRKPKPLEFGDTIGIIAPASQTSDNNREMAVKELKKLGFEVKLGKSCFEKHGYLAGDDELRARDLNGMFIDESVDAIMCLRGGYGTPRILNLIDFKSIRRNPKIFIGYSDITAIHVALNRISKLITFHGPMAGSDIYEGLDEFSRESFFKAVMDIEPIGTINNPEGEEIKSIFKGKAEGPVIGGNLALIASTIGTPYEIDTNGKILFLEEIGEEPYRVDRMLTQLALSGKFDNAEGIVLGDFKECNSKNKDSLTLLEVFMDRLAPYQIPTIYNLKVGHCTPKVTIPFGVKALLDADECKFTIVESAFV